MPMVAGTRLGTYELIAPLGAGGMGEVYRARDIRLGREVALKVLPAEVSADPERLARFEREARVVASLNHPNIVVLHSVEDVGNTRFLTMELVEGQSLDRHLTPGGLPILRLVELGIALSGALSAAHEKGVIHRDFKPANVMVTREGRVKVLDFGLAKLAEADSGTEMTMAETVATPLSGDGQVLGTVPYMAPEQIRGEAVDARTDLFALGIVLYELATGHRPFGGATFADISSAILRDAPAPLVQVRADLPSEFARVVERCLEKHPRERFQSAIDVMNDLRALRRSLEQGSSGAKSGPAPQAVASIAVLPFVNRSASADDEYFSDGLADELLNVLAKIKGLRVTARTSSFHFKGKDMTIAEIGKALDVATVLEGSVRKSGNRVRISVQLVSVANSSQLWSESYDRTLDDIFAVQDDIAQSVVKELRTTLLGMEADSEASGRAQAEVAKAAKGRGTQPEAHRLFLQARYLIDRMNREDVTRAIGYLEQALAIDSEFALGWAELGRAYGAQASRGWHPVDEGYARSKNAALRALSLEPELAEAHAQLGFIQMSYEWDLQGARVSVERALELAPGNASALRRAGALASHLGKREDAIALYRRAVEQDPLGSTAYINLGLSLFGTDRFAEAEAAYRKALELAPQMAFARALLSLVLNSQSRGEEALVEASREPVDALRQWALAIVHHNLGSAAASDAALDELIQKHADDYAFQVASAHGARGEIDAAFEWLERSYAQRDSGLIEMKRMPEFRSLHGDLRWDALLQKIGLPRD